MSSVTKAVAASIRRYPELYPCRTDVLHHWFCVGGNGLHWHNGKVIDPYSESIYPEREFTVPKNLREDPRYLAETAWDKVVVGYRVANADLLAQVEWKNDSSIASPRPISRMGASVLMANVPDDVKPDWLAAVREMIFEVFASPTRPDTEEEKRSNNDFVGGDMERGANILFASAILTSLAERFGDGGKPKDFTEWKERRSRAVGAMARMLAVFGDIDEGEE